MRPRPAGALFRALPVRAAPRAGRAGAMQPRTRLHRFAPALLAAFLLACEAEAPAVPARAPEHLSETGLYVDAVSGQLAPGVRAFTPQYPLWSDGATKRRWVYLPPGATIDASDPEAWQFPIGTKFWKEFSFGRRVETRYMERVADGSWLYATYLWPENGSEALRASEEGVRGYATTALDTRHDVPGVQDCRACHEGHPSRVLGFGALQLAAERDPLAPHAEEPAPGGLTLAELLAGGRLTGSPAALLAAAQPIEARTARERAALGYLHANCGGCHNGRGPLASLGLELEYRRGGEAPALRTALGVESHFRPAGAEAAPRIAAGDPAASVLTHRMGSRFGPTQMPPLGTHAPDLEALALVQAWILRDLVPTVASKND